MKHFILTTCVLLLMSGTLFATGQVATDVTGDDEVVEISTVRLTGASHRYYGDDTPEDNIWTDYMMDRYKIRVVFNWIITGKMSDYSQKLNLSVMSGEVPDVFHIPNINVLQDFAQAGHLMEVKPVFDRLAVEPFKKRVNIYNGMLWTATQVDGKNYTIPDRKFFFQDNKSLWIRQDWLDGLGLEAPSTLDEMYEVAKAFATQDPDGNGKADTVGFGFDNTLMSWMASIDPFVGMFGTFPGTWLKGIWVKDDSGGLVYSSMRPGMREGLAELAKWYDEGLVNQDFVTQKESVLAQMIGAGTVGMYFGSPWNPSWPHPDTLKNVPGAVWKPYPIPDGPDGTHVLFDTPIIGGAGTAYSKEFKHIERLFEYYNDKAEEYTTPGDTEYNLKYELGKYTEEDPEAGGVKRIPGVENHCAAFGIGNDPFRYKELIRMYDAGYHLDPKRYKPQTPIAYWHDLQLQADQPDYMAALRICVQEEPNVLVDQFQAASPGPVHQETWGFLQSMELEYISKIIMGELPISAWDEFVVNWRKSGGDRLTEEVNTWWDSAR
jgi:putative aldouronate transport system substrate-binding protein